MASSLTVDLIIAFILLAAMFLGWRQGAFSSVLSTIGVAAAIICGAVLAPVVMRQIENTNLRFFAALVILIALVGLGNTVGGMLGMSLRESLPWKKLRTLDSAVGAAFQACAAVAVIWIVSVPLVTLLPSTTAQGMQDSRVLGFVDAHAPDALAPLPGKISAMLNDSGIPPLVSPFEAQRGTAVEAPAIKVQDAAMVERVRPSIVHVVGESEACARRLLGSGFVVDDRHVITNAHVVAGTEIVRLDTVLGVIDARVVSYNPDLDIAVLESDSLNLPALPWAPEPARRGDDAVVMGFPKSGPFEAAPARISDRITIAGPNIYASGRVERESYTVRGSIRQGNSGGPLIDAEGRVLGVVFGASVDNSDIGYALTAQEVRSQIGDVANLSVPVDTQECVAH